MGNLLNIFTEYQVTITLLSGLSIGTFVLSIISVPWMVCRIPESYFMDLSQKNKGQRSLLVRLMIVLVKNVLGAGFVFLGFVLLFIPGQGLLTIFFGLVLMDFPGKKKVVQWLVGMEKVQASLNWIREKRRVEPLRFPVS